MMNRTAKLLFFLVLEAAGCEFAIGIARASAAFVLSLMSASRPTASNQFRVRQAVRPEAFADK
jgi:hypothetical protein